MLPKPAGNECIEHVKHVNLKHMLITEPAAPSQKRTGYPSSGTNRGSRMGAWKDQTMEPVKEIGRSDRDSGSFLPRPSQDTGKYTLSAVVWRRRRFTQLVGLGFE
jgi:hypothetical protein